MYSVEKIWTEKHDIWKNKVKMVFYLLKARQNISNKDLGGLKRGGSNWDGKMYFKSMVINFEN